MDGQIVMYEGNDGVFALTSVTGLINQIDHLKRKRYFIVV